MSAVERKRMIEERQKTSIVWRTIHFFGSLKLALFLLAIIAIACAVATFTESKFNANVAQAHIYKAPWFIFWLALLCVNLFAVTLTRWPWQKKHTGFIITHYGIILLLIGAVIGNRLGFEGNVTLDKTASPVTRIVTSQSVIQVGNYVMPFDGEVRRPSEKRPVVLAVPETPLKVVIDGYSRNMDREPAVIPFEEGLPVVLLRLESGMVAQSILVPLGLAPGSEKEHDFFGMATMAFLESLPERQASERETRVVFAKFAPVSESGAARSPLQIRLSEDGETVTIGDTEGNGATYPRTEIQGREVPTPLGNVRVVEYWPDFEMKDNKPRSASSDPNNPAIMVLIDSAPQADSGSRPRLEIAMDGQAIRYQTHRGGAPILSGRVEKGESFNLGWADWKATVEEVEPKARVGHRAFPNDSETGASQDIPGLRLYLENAKGEKSEPVWVESGSVETLHLGTQSIQVGYGLETKRVDFSIALLDFEVPREEGTDKPADYISTIEFKDLTSGETREAIARMNHPASFPGNWWNVVSGYNYKFSQAQWNPRNLNETTLQVLYDPGWLFKWMGSLAICAGIAIMFYWKPKTK